MIIKYVALMNNYQFLTIKDNVAQTTPLDDAILWEGENDKSFKSLMEKIKTGEIQSKLKGDGATLKRMTPVKIQLITNEDEELLYVFVGRYAALKREIGSFRVNEKVYIGDVKDGKLHVTDVAGEDSEWVNPEDVRI